MIPIANTPLPIASLVIFFPLGTNVLLINHQFTKSIGKFISSSHWFIITRYWHELLVKLQTPFCSIVIYLDRNTKLLVLKCCCFFTQYSMLTGTLFYLLSLIISLSFGLYIFLAYFSRLNITLQWFVLHHFGSQQHKLRKAQGKP